MHKTTHDDIFNIVLVYNIDIHTDKFTAVHHVSVYTSMCRRTKGMPCTE